MDDSRVAMVELHLNKTGFDTFKLKRGGVAAYGLKQLLRILKGVKPPKHNADGSTTNGEQLTLHSDAAKLELLLERDTGDGNAKYVRTFTVREMDGADTELPPRLKVTFDGMFKCDVNTLRTVINDAKKVSDVITLTLDNDGVQVTAEGDVDLGTYTSSLTKDALIDLDVSKRARARFALEVLSRMVQHLPNNAFLLKVNLADEMPCLIETLGVYDTLEYWLAPRIEVD
jgi:hypothetical protein